MLFFSCFVGPGKVLTKRGVADKDPGDSECSLDLGYAALFHSECDVPDHSDVVVRRSLGRLYGEHWCHGLDSCDLFLWIRILDVRTEYPLLGFYNVDLRTHGCFQCEGF